MDDQEKYYQNLFRDRFDGFAPDPPEASWEHIRDALRRDSADSSANPSWFFQWIRLKYILYPMTIVVILAALLVIFWEQEASTTHLHGKASIGSDSLLQGTACLFRVNDHQPPLDSVCFHQMVPLDSSGAYHFSDVPHGTYMVRIHLHPGSPGYPEYQFGYYGDELLWDSSDLIDTRNGCGPYNVLLSPLP